MKNAKEICQTVSQQASLEQPPEKKLSLLTGKKEHHTNSIKKEQETGG